MNIGPGKDSRFASAETLYTPEQVPGIDRQTNFLRYGGFAQFDWRDDPFGPKRGGNYTVSQGIHFKDSSMHPASIQTLFPHDSQNGRLCKEALHGIDCS